MKAKDKQLLLQDLCARLPYGVKVYFKFEPDKGEMFESHGILESINIYNQIEIDSNKLFGQLLSLEYNEIKPYLFPLSSMTKEQKGNYGEYYDIDLGNSAINIKDQIIEGKETINWFPLYNHIDYLIANHFDYRGLIPMGLAIDATGLNIY